MDAPKDRDSVYHSGVRIPPPLVYLGGFGVGLLLEKYFPADVIPAIINKILAVLCIGLAVVISSWSFVSFRRARTSPLPIKPTTALVTDGPYRFTRNPMYLSLAFLYAGHAGMFGLFWPLALLPAVIFIMRYYVIAGEESYLERKFGKEYLDYKARVRRWI